MNRLTCKLSALLLAFAFSLTVATMPNPAFALRQLERVEVKSGVEELHNALGPQPGWVIRRLKAQLLFELVGNTPIVRHRQLRYDEGTINQHLVKGLHGEWWVHMHLDAHREADVSSEGFLFRVRRSSNGEILGLDSSRIEPYIPLDGNANRPFILPSFLAEGLEGKKQEQLLNDLSWVLEQAEQIFKESKTDFEAAIRADQPAYVLAEAVEPENARGLFIMLEAEKATEPAGRFIETIHPEKKSQDEPTTITYHFEPIPITAAGVEEFRVVPVTRDYATAHAQELGAVDVGEPYWGDEGTWGAERFPMDNRPSTGTALNDLWKLSFAAEDSNGTSVAYIYVTNGHLDYPVAQKHPGAFVFRLSVRPDVQGNKLGPRLLLEAAQAARRSGVGPWMTLETNKNNDRARRVYEKLGFVLQGGRFDDKKNVTFVEYAVKLDTLIERAEQSLAAGVEEDVIASAVEASGGTLQAVRNMRIATFAPSPDVDGPLTRAARKVFEDLAREAIAQRGQFVVALSGGRTPQLLYELLAGSPRIDWSKVHIFSTDERKLSADGPGIGYDVVEQYLLSHLPGAKPTVHWVDVNIDPETAARNYEQEIRQLLGEDLRFDLMITGAGADRHILSILPRSPLLNRISVQPVEVISHPAAYQNVGYTLTPTLLQKARQVVLVLTGEEKRQVLQELAGRVGDVSQSPILLMDDLRPGILSVFTDQLIQTTAAGAEEPAKVRVRLKRALLSRFESDLPRLIQRVVVPVLRDNFKKEKDRQRLRKRLGEELWSYASSLSERESRDFLSSVFEREDWQDALFRWVNVYILLAKKVAMEFTDRPEGAIIQLLPVAGYELLQIPESDMPLPVIYTGHPLHNMPDTIGSSYRGVAFVRVRMDTPSVAARLTRLEEVSHAVDYYRFREWNKSVRALDALDEFLERIGLLPSASLGDFFIPEFARGEPLSAWNNLGELRAFLRGLALEDTQAALELEPASVANLGPAYRIQGYVWAMASFARVLRKDPYLFASDVERMPGRFAAQIKPLVRPLWEREFDPVRDPIELRAELIDRWGWAPSTAGLEELSDRAKALDERIRKVAADLKWLAPFGIDLDDPHTKWAVHLGAHVRGSGSPPTLTYMYNKIPKVPFLQKGIRWVSIPLDTDPADLAETLRAIEEHPKIQLVTVTQPHKIEVGRWAQEWDSSVEPMRTTNHVLIRRDEAGRFLGTIATNSDGPAFVRQYQQVWGRRGNIPGTFQDKTVVILGGWGGLGQALTTSILKEGPRQLILTEIPTRLESARAQIHFLREQLSRLMSHVPEVTPLAADDPALQIHLRAAQVLINATGIGMDDETSPISDPQVFRDNPNLEVLDSIYRNSKGESRPVPPLLRQAWEAGIRHVYNGVGLTMRDQAWEAAWVSRQWFGDSVKIDEEEIYQAVNEWGRKERGLREAQELLLTAGLEEGWKLAVPKTDQRQLFQSYEQMVASLEQELLENRKRAGKSDQLFWVGSSGRVAAGKTELAKRLTQRLLAHGHHAIYLSEDELGVVDRSTRAEWEQAGNPLWEDWRNWLRWNRVYRVIREIHLAAAEAAREGHPKKLTLNELYRRETGRTDEVRSITIHPDTIVVYDAFLLQEMYMPGTFDFRVLVDISAEESISRQLHRDQWRNEATIRRYDQQLYRPLWEEFVREFHPERPSQFIVDLTNFAQPARLFYPQTAILERHSVDFESLQSRSLHLLVEVASRGAMLREGLFSSVYPFPGRPDLVLKVPKPLPLVVSSMLLQGDPPDQIYQKARRRLERQLDSFRLAAQRAGGVVASFRLYELSDDSWLPYVVVQRRAQTTIGDRLRHWAAAGDLSGVPSLFSEGLQLQLAALSQGFRDLEQNFTVNNGLMVENSIPSQRILDLGAFDAHRPQIANLARKDQWSVRVDLPSIHTDLAVWYTNEVIRAFGQLTEHDLGQLWNSKGAQPIQFPQADEAVRQAIPPLDRPPTSAGSATEPPEAGLEEEGSSPDRFKSSGISFDGLIAAAREHGIEAFEIYRDRDEPRPATLAAKVPGNPLTDPDAARGLEVEMRRIFGDQVDRQTYYLRIGVKEGWAGVWAEVVANAGLEEDVQALVGKVKDRTIQLNSRWILDPKLGEHVLIRETVGELTLVAGFYLRSVAEKTPGRPYGGSYFFIRLERGGSPIEGGLSGYQFTLQKVDSGRPPSFRWRTPDSRPSYNVPKGLGIVGQVDGSLPALFEDTNIDVPFQILVRPAAGPAAGPPTAGLEEIRAISKELRADVGVADLLNRNGWVSLTSRLNTAGYGRKAMVVSNSAPVEGGHIVVAPVNLSNPRAEALIPWVKVQSSDPAEIIRAAKGAGARPGDLILLDAASGLEEGQIQRLLMAHRLQGVRVVVGTPSQVEVLPPAAFNLFAGLESSLPPVIFLDVATGLEEEAGVTHTLLLMN